MSHAPSVLEGATLAACLAPVLLLLVLATSALAGRGLGERGVGIATRAGLMTALIGALIGLAVYLTAGRTPTVLSYGTWFVSAEGGFSFGLAVSGLSLGAAVLALGICNVVAAFSFRYLHREPGYHRYFVQMAMFAVGITLIALAGSIEVLFVGWELLGLSSALLVGFFHERRAPVDNALRVFGYYRLSDAAMLSAAVLLHHWAGSGSLARIFWGTAGPSVALSAGHALAISILLIVAVAGKSALWPLSDWLPRAMEGPTPSSAVYYGALSVHAGCFLLLRAQPLLARSAIATGLVAVLGLTTSLHAAVTARVQTDVKSALSYATLTQVGLITVEIALGLRTLALLHMAGHVCFRLLQFLSAPNVLHDLHALEDRLGGHLPRDTGRLRHGRWGTSLYLVALERGFAESLVERLVVRPFRALAGGLDRFDRLLVGRPGRGGGGRR